MIVENAIATRTVRSAFKEGQRSPVVLAESATTPLSIEDPSDDVERAMLRRVPRPSSAAHRPIVRTLEVLELASPTTISRSSREPFHPPAAAFTATVPLPFAVPLEPPTPLVRGFRDLVASRGEERDRLFDALIQTPNAAALVLVSVREFQNSGGDERLALGASLASAIGPASLPAIELLACFRAPEAEYFVDTAANMKRVPEVDRYRVLLELARNPSPDCRLRVLDSLDVLSAPHRRALLLELRADHHPDVSEAAADRLADDP